MFNFQFILRIAYNNSNSEYCFKKKPYSQSVIIKMINDRRLLSIHISRTRNFERLFSERFATIS